jgi:hypothetical protein
MKKVLKAGDWGLTEWLHSEDFFADDRDSRCEDRRA